MSKQQKHQLLAWHSQGKELPPHQLALVEAIKFEYIESAKRRNRSEPVRLAHPPPFEWTLLEHAQLFHLGRSSLDALNTNLPCFPPSCVSALTTPTRWASAGGEGGGVRRER
jgi:hypothetical protein